MPATTDLDPLFDTPIDRRGTHSCKWDLLPQLYGLDPADALAMWVADMDFRPPACISDALRGMLDHGVFGYFGDDRDYLAAITGWMRDRHDWTVAPEAILTTHGLVNGTALAIDALTAPGDGIVLMTPVYHAFARIIRDQGRSVVECPLTLGPDGRHAIDFAETDRRIAAARPRMLILCSPHNPGGRVWNVAELQGVADLCRRHNLWLLSDEIHHDLVFPGGRHVPMPVAVPDIADRLVMMTATTKTFNIAGAHTGNLIVPDPELRERIARRLAGLGMSPNSFGLAMATAAYSPAGAAWVDRLMAYLDGNRQLFDRGVEAIPGVRAHRLQATYLAWVDFGKTGMSDAEIRTRVEAAARIATNHGPSFGTGGAAHLRINLGAPRAVIAAAVDRLQAAFADLQ